MNHSGKSLGTLGELFPDSAVTCRMTGCHSLIPVPRGGTAPADQLCDSCREQLATLHDRQMPCSGSGCTATWRWSRQQQHEALLRSEPPPRRLCDACKNKRNAMQDKAMPCRIKGCSGTWVLTRDEQWRDDGTAGQARFCPACFQKYQTLRDQAVPCRIKGCHSSWTWNRYQQLEQLAAGKALAAPPKRMCRDCAAKVAALKDADVPCKVKNCQRTVPFPAFAQLEHLLNHPPDHPAQGRMCAECFRFLSATSDQAMPCRHRGCPHTWPLTRNTQLQDWLAGRPPPQGRLCDVCTRRIKETKERAMPCAVPGCTQTWTYGAADQVRDRCAGKPAPAGRRCPACEAFQAKHPAMDVPCATCGASIAWSAYEQLLTEKGAFTKPTVCAACNEKTLAVKRQEPPVHRDEAHKNVIRLPGTGRWNQDPAIAQRPPHLTQDAIIAAQTADLRIVALGDDLTWSAADPAEAWPALLQQKLNEDTSRRACVINAGIPATTSAQGAVRVPRDVTAFAPHVVIVSFVLGDAWVDPVTDYDRHPRHRLPPEAASQGLQELFAKLKELGCPILFWTPNPILPEDEAERLGPDQFKWASEMAASFDHAMAQARHLCAQQQIPVVDVHARFEVNGKKSTRHWMRDWCHHNPAGARNIAAWLAEALFPLPPYMHAWQNQLETLDRQLLELLNARCRLIGETAAGIADPEQALWESGELERLLTAGQGPLSTERAKAIFREIQAATLELRQAPAVAYLGPSGTNTHQAALGRFGNTVHYLARPTIPDVFEAVTRNQAAFGVVPVENSTEGAVTYTLDMFADSPVKISAEINMRIHNHLIGSGSREGLRVLYSHPQVFGQCRQWLRRHLPAVPLVETFSTTEAAARAAAEDDAGAIAGPLAAEQYRLPVMEANIEDTAGNTTRFFVIGTRDTAPTGNDKTSILFAIKDRVGALLDSLEPFRRHGISLSFIESRPSRRKSWDYHFFVDFVGHTAEPTVQAMLHDLGEQCQSVKLLGSYPRAAAPT